MGTYLVILVVAICIAAVPAALRFRLRERHPEIHAQLIEHVVVDNVSTTRFRVGALWRFLARRSHKALNDPTLSLLSDMALGGLMLFIIGVLGGLIWIFASAFRQIV